MTNRQKQNKRNAQTIITATTTTTTIIKENNMLKSEHVFVTKKNGGTLGVSNTPPWWSAWCVLNLFAADKRHPSIHPNVFQSLCAAWENDWCEIGCFRLTNISNGTANDYKAHCATSSRIFSYYHYILFFWQRLPIISYKMTDVIFMHWTAAVDAGFSVLALYIRTFRLNMEKAHTRCGTENVHSDTIHDMVMKWK